MAQGLSKRMPNTEKCFVYVQMLKLVGAGGHYPTNKLQADEAEDSDANAAQPSTTSSSLENLKGRAEALAETGLFAFYKVCFCCLLYGPLKLLFGLMLVSIRIFLGKALLKSDSC